MGDLDPRKQLRFVARRQLGLVTRSQALALSSESAINRRLESGEWEKFFPRVYRLGGCPDSFLQRLRGACFSVGPEAVASHRTAGYLWGLDGLSRSLPTPIEVTASMSRGACLPGIVIHRSRTLADAGRSSCQGIPTTHLARTVVDLARVLPEEAVELALDSAWRKSPNLVAWLSRYLEQLGTRGQSGVGFLGRLLRLRQRHPTDSPLERKVLRVIRREGLPQPEWRVDVVDEHGGHVARPDFIWREQRVAVFGDSFAHHADRKSFDNDREQRARLDAYGWHVIAVSDRLVKWGTWLDALKRHLRVGTWAEAEGPITNNVGRARGA